MPNSAGMTRAIAAVRPIRLTARVWLKLTLGFAAAFFSGGVYAVILERSGGWERGTAWDVALLHRLHPTLPRWADVILVSVPWLGTNITIITALIPYGAWLWRRGRADIVVRLGVATLGSYLLNLGLKFLYGRPRPSLWARRGEYSWSSYPSGHVIAFTSVLFFSVWLLQREQGWRWPYVVWLVAFVTTLYSRLYLGVHWPTDIVGAFIIGLVWLGTLLAAFGRHRAAALPDSPPAIRQSCE